MRFPNDSTGTLSFQQGDFHSQIAAALEMGSVAEGGGLVDEGVVVVDELDLL
jgi:hypothetical protein